VRRSGLPLVIACCAVALVGWNVSRFVGAEGRIRAKDLTFLPSPATARLLALGHTNTVAKLRWIDSFAYFQYQLDRLDDHVAGAGGDSGVVRLYDTLIHLDPHFRAFYEHAALNLAAVLGRQQQGLAFLALGTLNLPEDTLIWRNLASTLSSEYRWEQHLPGAFDGFLSTWAAAETSEGGRQQVWHWKAGLARRKLPGLEQMPYWLEKLRATAPGTPSGDYLEGVVREQLARYGERELNGLLAVWRIRRGGTARTTSEFIANRDLLDPLAPAVDNDRLVPAQIEELLDRPLLVRRYPQGMPAFVPVAVVGDRPVLRNDPYGLAWELHGGQVVSQGLRRQTYERRLAWFNVELQRHAAAAGRWPDSLPAIAALALKRPLPPPPEDGRLELKDHWVTVVWNPEPKNPWVLR
jgi:hypothetical protein